MSATRPPPGFQFTVADMIDAEGGRDEAYSQQARAGLLDKDTFLATLYRDLDEAIDDVQSDAAGLVNANEDAISRRIVSFLRGRRYDAWSEPFENGHVDVHVRSRRLQLKWNGEAKIHGKYDHAMEGMKQLLTRYASGAHHHGGFLLYVRRKNAKLIVKKWRKKLELAVDPDPIATLRTDDEAERRFRSTHKHSSGTDYVVRHHIVLLHFKPKDASGVNADVSTDDDVDEDENDLS